MRDLLVCQRVPKAALTLRSRNKVMELPLHAKLAHLLLLMSSDPEIGARVPRAQQYDGFEPCPQLFA